MKTSISICLVLLLAVLGGAVPAAAGAGNWYEGDGAKIRLLAIRDAASGVLKAGLQVELEPGWKTYWRTPGGSGVPPQVDFSQSKNVASTSFHYPMPKLIGDGGGVASGYSKSVTFPIEVEPLFSNRDVTLTATGLIGVCAEICIPMPFSVTLDEPANGSTSLEAARLVNAAFQSVPKQPGPDFKVAGIKFAENGTLNAVVHLPKGHDRAELHLEADRDWYLIPAVAEAREDGTAAFTFDLPSGTSDPQGAKITATIVSGGRAVEQQVTVE